MSQFETLHVASFDLEGELTTQQAVDRVAIETDRVESFKRSLTKLSGDLDLPLEVVVPDMEHLVLRICSDRHQAAYTVYYFHDEAVFASLLLPGRDLEIETELTQVLRFLLLDTSDEDEPDEEVIEEILTAPEFRFEAIETRPATIQIALNDDESISTELEQIAEIDQQVAVAFFELDR